MKHLPTTRWILTAGAVVALVLLSASGPAFADARLGTQVVPTRQAITLTIDAAQLPYTGTTQIDLNVTEAVSAFTLHAEDMEITELTLENNGRPVEASFTLGEHAIIEVTTTQPLQTGKATLKLQFTDLLDTTNNALYQIEEEGAFYTFTQFEPDDAREAFPCYDEPGFKIPFQMTLIVPEHHTAVFNTPIENESVADGQRTIVFQESKPMPSYLIAFATGELESVDIPGMSVPGRIWSVKGKSHLTGEVVRQTPLIVAALERYFNSPYPYEKCDLLAVPGKGGAMENPGAITYGEGLLLLDPATISVSQRRAMAAVNAHELAHIWFGDLVTLAWWDETWLNESFASWMGDKITHEVFPEFGMDINALREGLGAMVTDARPSTRAIRRPVEATDNLNLAFDVLAYSKGQAVLGMMEEWLGPNILRRGVQNYISAHTWGTTTALDFWDALSAASGKDVATIMSTYLDQPGVPWVSVEMTLDNKIKLTQKRFSNYGVAVPEDAMWQVPVVLKYSDGIKTQTQTVLLDDFEKTVELYSLEGPPVWILPNSGMHGYYRWSVPPSMLSRLAEKAAEELEVGERVGFISNLAAQLDAGTIKGDDFLRTLNHFADDPDAQVISSLLGALDKVRRAFVTDDNEEAFAQYVRHTLGPALQRFGRTKREGESEIVTGFRPNLIGWLGDEGMDESIRHFADSLTDRYLADPTAIDPQMAGTALYLTAAFHGDRALFDECKQRFESAQAPRERSRFLSTLGHFRDPELRDEALAYALKGSLRPNDMFNILGSVESYRKNEDLVFDWFIANYDVIMSKLPPMFAAYMPFIAGGCSRERLAKGTEFFTAPERFAPGIDEQLAKVTDQVNDCAGLREREGMAVNKYLDEFAAMN